MASRLSVFLAELKRRKVGRVAVVYAVVGLALIEAADLILPSLRLEWLYPAVVVLALVGFPVAIVLAWAVEVTPDGIRRTPELTAEETATQGRGASGHGSWLLGLAGLALVSVGGWFVLLRGDGSAAEAGLVENRVFVTLFANQTGDPALDPAGRMAADFIIRDLVTTGRTEVLPIEAAVTLAAEAETGASGPTSLQGDAERFGARYLISGSFFAQGDSLVVQGQILDVAEGRVRSPIGPVTASREEPARGLTELSQRAAGILAGLLDPTWSPGWGDFVPQTSYAAYAEYVAGTDAFMRSDWIGSIDRLTTAYVLDTTFIRPLLVTVTAFRNRGMQAQADSVRLLAERLRDRANPLEHTWLDLLRAWFQGDREGAYRAARRLAELVPGGSTTFQYGYEAIRTNRLHEAVEILEGMDPTRPDMASWVSYWTRLTRAHHMLGNHEVELDVAHRARELLPATRSPLNYEARALAALGRVDEALVALEEYRARGATHINTDVASELRIHGHPRAANEVLEHGLAWCDAQPDDPETQSRLRPDRAWALYNLERWDEAGAIYAQLHAQDPENLTNRGRLGYTSARLGDRDEAFRIDGELQAMDRPYLWGMNTLWRAYIAAGLGEHDRAVGLLRQAHREGLSYGTALHHAIELRALRDHPGFQAFMRPRG